MVIIKLFYQLPICLDKYDQKLIGSEVFNIYTNLDYSYNSEFSDECHTLQMKEVQWAARLIPSNALRRFKSSRDSDGFVPDLSADTQITKVTYQVKVVASPGGAIFEASLSYDLSQEEYSFKVSFKFNY